MAEIRVRRRAARHSADCPEIAIVSASGEFSVQPLTLFQVELIAGDAGHAAVSLATQSSDSVLLTLRAEPGGTARFVPAAPAFITQPLSITLSGADAVASIAYR